MTEPVAGNFFPLTAAMHIQDDSRQLAILTDRAQGELTQQRQGHVPCNRARAACHSADGAHRARCCPLAAGGSSLSSGEMEVMVHRRILKGAGAAWGSHAHQAGCCRPPHGLEPSLLPLLPQMMTGAWPSR